ncbi:ESX secretion-associated protein EspG [Nocardia sp. AG03]|uniref:ESX secretion-associated protein EspG n=1 Tax=Nocardia sp. AG03 TaxID=3025312 RepID=UPI00241873B2|nr:ESX secretion-associated protein EspG [Nocardia sp. AG03]
MTAFLEFTPVEFAAMWRELKEVGLPAPLTYRGPEQSFDESRRVERAAWQELRRGAGGALDQLVAALTEPDIRVVARGIDGREPQNPKRSLRVLAVRKGEDSFVVVQRPGETLSDAAGFTVTRHDAVSMGDAVAAVFPAATAGRRREFGLHDATQTDLDFSYGRSLVHEDGDDTATRSREFANEPDELAGSIEIEQGWSRFGPRGVLRLHLVWRDVIDDGRYVIVPGTPARVVPVDRRGLVSLLNSQIAEIVRAIRDDRA